MKYTPRSTLAGVKRLTTEIDERRIDTLDLRIGMFVCRLDRPWEGTPFPLQGVELHSDADINALRELCRFVYIDTHHEVVDGKPLQVLSRASLDPQRFRPGSAYEDKASVDEELPRAIKALANITEMVDRIYADITSGRELSVEDVEAAVRPLVASVLRSADAFLYVEGLRKHDSYSYSHAISCSALAAAFGRHMGFPHETIISLAAGGLLMDVGKTRLPEALLQYQGTLSSSDVELVRSHVAQGLDILAHSKITDADVVDGVRTHHERHDGSGYPAGQKGTAIPVAGRILGIIDSYDAMSSVRPYRPANSRHQSLQHIYGARDTLFQAQMVEQFLVCLGTYPTGSLVELTSGEVAVVMAQNHVRRLRPKVLVLSTASKQPLTEFHVLDLMAQGEVKNAIAIERSLASGDYGIDVAEYFLEH
jgi:HD-GYP domain-containing protein (c-di-GMP phosphodiesterase class II)